MNNKLRKQIKTYTGLAGAILAAGKTTAQIVYVNQDTLLDANPANSGVHHFILDVNNDAVDDIDFMVDHITNLPGHKFTRVSPLNGLQIGNSFFVTYYAGGSSSFTPFPAHLNPGDTINVNFGSWLDDPNEIVRGLNWGSTTSNSWNWGYWPFQMDKCLPFRLVQGSDFYYGWIKIKLLGYDSLRIKEYAYQLQPNVPMLACLTTDLSTGIEQMVSQCNFTQQNNSIHISSLQKLNNANISVYDLLGKEILQQPFERNETTITINKKGIYFVEVKSDHDSYREGIFRKKIFIY